MEDPSPGKPERRQDLKLMGGAAGASVRTWSFSRALLPSLHLCSRV